MSEPAAPQKQPDEETRRAVAPIEEQLEATLANVDTPEKAEALVERLTADAGERTAVAVGEEAPHVEAAAPEAQATITAETVERAVAAERGDVIREAAAAIETTAAEAVALEGPAYEALAEVVQAVTGPVVPEPLVRSRRYVRDAIMRRMSPFQKYDTALFLAINNSLPRTPAINAFFRQISFWFNGGWVWIIGVALFWPVRPAAAAAILRRISVPIWVATLVVEGPVKQYFRRRRPFIDVLRAIVVGKKPANWSFPSGHSASAFAGAWMMSRHLPRWQPLWYTLAALVAFSRIYLGVHYPSDVVSGSFLGLVLAEGTRRLLRLLER